jgi:DNA mismatch repair protein MutS
MSQDRRVLRAQLQREFPDLELHDWYSQYRGLKFDYPDAVLFYRMGDFYEAFDDDAKLIAELMSVTLTSKEFATLKGSKERRKCPMAGMPYHAIERYAGELIKSGYRVAIAEQISETPSSRADTRPRSVFAAGLEQSSGSKGMVERKVVRVLTPGTIIEPSLLAADQNNYLAALISEAGQIGLAYVDLSTGEFAATELVGERAAGQAQSELARLLAAELLVPDKQELRLPGLEPGSARLTQDLEFMSKEERELLLPGERVARRMERENTARWAHGHLTAVPAWRWEARTAREALLRQMRASTLAGFGLADKPLAARAAGAIVQYLEETQAGAITHITSIRAYTIGATMVLDPQTRRNLELLEGSGGRAKGSLVGVIDQTRTPMGARTLRRWIAQPLLDLVQLEARQQAVAHFVDDTLLRAEVRELLRQVGDTERAVNRLMQGAAVATPRDMVRLREGLRVLPSLIERLQGWLPPRQDAPVGALEPDEDALPAEEGSADPPVQPIAASPPPSLRERREAKRNIQARNTGDELFDEGDEPLTVAVPIQAPPMSALPIAAVRAVIQPIVGVLDPCADVLALLERAIDDDPPALLGASNYLRAAEEQAERPRRVIRPGYEPAMDAVVAASKDAQQWISDLEAVEQRRTGIKGLRVDYNKVFGYYIEVAKSYADQVPADYIRKQTLTSGERYITPTLKKYEEIVENAQQRLVELERRAFAQIVATVAEQGPRLLATARALAETDVYAGLAEAAVRGRYVRPRLYDDTRLSIVNGRHPVVERTLDEAFIPNHADLDTDLQQIMLVTGPNMAGKSCYLRQVALIVLMAQIGAYVPADSAEIGLVDRIFTRIGAQDDIATGQSTFMVEMTETAALLLQSTRRSLIILDEVGRGTSTYDGLAIARAVLEYIHNEPRLGCRTLFATHYHELTALEGLLPRVRNVHLAAIEQDGQVVFLHELRSGGADRSYGIHVAELAGIPRGVIRRAGELLAELEGRPPPERRASTPKQRQAPLPSDNQLALFVPPPHPAVEQLRRLQVNELTPLEALTRLYELQRLVADHEA